MINEPVIMPIRILLVDADAFARQQVTGILGKTPGRFEISEAGDRAGLETFFSETTDDFAFDIVLSESIFPEIPNFDPIALVRSKGTCVPVIIFSSNRSIHSVIDAFKNGVSDYILKSEKNYKLLPAIIKSVKSSFEMEGKLNGNEKAEAKVRAYADEIVRKNQALAEARDRAIEASRLKSEYLAMMGHEIRTPMNAMTGMADLLLDTPLTREQKDYVDILRDSSQVLLTLINDILDFSKIEAGKLALEKIEFNPLELAESAVEVFESNARQKAIDLMMYISPQVPQMVRGDPMRLRQVLTNLISNAIKFTESGEVEVREDLLEETDKFVMLLFQVRDTGIGLSEESQSSLFQPFTQAEGSISRKYGGTGLGLAISRRLVELMDGEISLSSTLGQGSTFWFTATFEKCSIPDLKPSWMTDFGSIGLKALVIDESSSYREVIKRYLEIMEMQVDEAQTVSQALQDLTLASQCGDPYHVAVIGFNLAVSDDLKLPAEVVQLASFSPTYTILLVPIDQRRLGESATQFGISAYVIKPVKRNRFLATVHQLLVGNQAPELVETPSQPVIGHMETRLPIVTGKEKNARHPILLVEDNLTNLKLSTLQLQKLGYSVEAVSSGKDAIEAVTRNPGGYLSILMDVHMVGLDGYETTRLIRELEKPKGGMHTPIIAMTASVLESDRSACFEAGMDDYVTKPVTLANLHKVLQTWGMQKYRSMVQTSSFTNRSQISPLLDASVLDDISSMQTPGEPDVLVELINIYLHDSVNYFNAIKQAAAANNREGLRHSIHSLKGSSGNIGARFFAARCAEMEKELEGNDVERMQSLLPQAELEYNQVCQALAEYRDDRNQTAAS